MITKHTSFAFLETGLNEQRQARDIQSDALACALDLCAVVDSVDDWPA